MSYLLSLAILILLIFLFIEYRRIVKAIDRLRRGTFVYVTGFTIPRFISLNNREFELEKIPTHFFMLLFLHEDNNFLSHKGFNLLEFYRALISVVFKRGLRGGSSITQQTAKNIFTDGKRSLRRKIHEALVTIILERKMTKEEILYLYLLIIKFGFGVFGLPSITKYLQIESLSQIRPEQSELILSLLPSPMRRINCLKKVGLAGYSYGASYEQLVIFTRFSHISGIDEEDKGIVRHMEVIKTLFKKHRQNPSLNLSYDEEMNCIIATTSFLNKMQTTLNRIVLSEFPKNTVYSFLCPWQQAFVCLIHGGEFRDYLNNHDEMNILFVAQKNNVLTFLSIDKAELYGLTLVVNAIKMEQNKSKSKLELESNMKQLFLDIVKKELFEACQFSPDFGKSIERFFSLD